MRNVTDQILHFNYVERKATVLTEQIVVVKDPIEITRYFKSIFERDFIGKIVSLDFNDPNARDYVDMWVESQTGKKIKNLIPRLESVMMSLSAHYTLVRGPWNYNMKRLPMSKFKGSENVEYEFFGGIQAVVHVKNDKYERIELEIGNRDLVMDIILPTVGNLKAVSNFLESGEYLKENEKKIVEFSVPKFTITKNYASIREFFGYPRPLMCSEGADVTHLFFPYDNVFLDDIYHANSISVDHNGVDFLGYQQTEENKLDNPSVIFKADRPFYFTVRFKPSNILLFLGHLVTP